MPIYEYRCPNGHTFERFQSMTAPAPEKCDVWQGEKGEEGRRVGLGVGLLVERVVGRLLVEERLEAGREEAQARCSERRLTESTL